jgi:hypothetical protein
MAVRQGKAADEATELEPRCSPCLYGGEQTWVVPAGVTNGAVSAYGAESGNGSFGSLATGIVAVTPGQTLYVEVGGRGDTPNPRQDACYGGGQQTTCYAGYGGFNGASAVSAAPRTTPTRA